MLDKSFAKQYKRKDKRSPDEKRGSYSHAKRSKTSRFLDTYNNRIFLVLLVTYVFCFLLLFILYFWVSPNQKLEVVSTADSNQAEFKLGDNIKYKYYTSEIDGDKFQGKYVSPWYKVTGNIEIYINGWVNFIPDNGLDLYLEIEKNGNFETLSYSGSSPGFKWEPWKATNLSGSSIRIIASDLTSDIYGWLAVSEPVRTYVMMPILRTVLIAVLFLVLLACVFRIAVKKTLILPYFLLAVSLICFFMLNYMFQSERERYFIRSDGVSYYTYLPSVIVDHDLTFETYYKNFAEHNISSHKNVDTVSTNGIGRGRINKYSVGPAVMALPFFLISHALAGILGVKQDGWNMLYGIFSAISACFYLLFGLALLYKYLKLRFSDKIVSVAMVSTIFGTNLLLYATYDSSFSHIYSFFAVSLLIFFTDRFYKSKSKQLVYNSVAVGVSIGLIALCRSPNVIIVIIFMLYGMEKLQDFIPRIKKYFFYYVLAAAVSLIVFIPQMAYFYYCTGRLIFNTYGAGGELFNFLNPNTINFLFSMNKGLLFWTPLWICAFIAPFVIFKNQRSPWFFALAIYMPIQLYVVSSWRCWWYGASFGQRPYVDIMFLYAVGLAYVLDWAEKKCSQDERAPISSNVKQTSEKMNPKLQKTKSASNITALVNNMIIAVVGFCLLRNIIFMSGYFNGIIPFERSTLTDISNAYNYFLPAFSNLSYLFFK